METFSKLISLFLILSFIFMFSCVNAHELTFQGKLGDEPLNKLSSVERDVKLICNVGKDEVESSKWSFKSRSSFSSAYVDLLKSCKEGEHSSSEEKDDDHLDCDVSDDKDEGQLVLKLKNIRYSAFGEYVCHTGNMTGKHFTVNLGELVHLSRRSDKGKLITASEIVDAGDPLKLYCNQTGLQPNIHRISWWRDGTNNITEKLKRKQGLFETFNNLDNGTGLVYEGTALLNHRGNYTCQVDLVSTNPEDEKFRLNYPVTHTFLVRVKVGDEWKLPVYVLLGECALIGLFTAFINWREKNVNEDDITIEDSEDEDDVQDGKNKNGTQNNNSSGNGSGK